jgi:serine/threonine protein kinase
MVEEELSGDRRVGQTLSGKWRLDRLIGEGGMASVYAATHRNGATAAIKILYPELARRADIRTRFLREAYIANKAGKGAVQVLDDDVGDDGAPYLVMELLRGEPVDMRAARLGGRLAVRDVVWIAKRTLSTLADAHAAGIVHRDLKPENLFWTTDERIKILDFGIARLRDATNTEMTQAGVIMGTLGFMSPEQALGDSSEIDLRTDIFAMGAIIFRLLTGKELHDGIEGNPLVVAATRKAPPLREAQVEAPRDLARVVDRALEFRRDARYAGAREMREDLERIGPDQEPVEPAVESLRIPPTRVPLIDLPTDSSRFSDVEPASMGHARQMSDADADALREVLSLVEAALVSHREVGPAHPKSIRKLDAAYRRAVLALSEAHIGLFCNVRPDGFFARGQDLLWQTKPPMPQASLRMYEDGVRMLGFLPGLSKLEFEGVSRLLACDLGGFGDYATLLKASGYAHVVFRIDAGQHDSFAEETDSLVSSGQVVPAGVILASLAAASDPSERATLLSRLEKRAVGQETAIGQLLAGASVDLAMGLLHLLRDTKTDAAHSAMEAGLRSSHPIVRIAALGQLGLEGDRLRAELSNALETSDHEARLATLLEIEKYKVKPAGPLLALRARSRDFDTLSIKERRLSLQALAALWPSRAEAIAVELLKSKRLLSSEAHEITRELAADLLGRIGTSQDAREALAAAAETRWRERGRVRDVAAEALAGVDHRRAATPRGRRPSKAPRR